MKSISGRSAQRAVLRIGCRQAVLASLFALTACGGRSQEDARSTPGMVSSGGTATATGGASTTGDGTGGAIADAGSDGGQANSCDLTLLFHSVLLAGLAGGLGTCTWSADPGLSDTYGKPTGTIVLDGEGRVAVTGFAQNAAYTLADDRWPCSANTTFFYWCSIAV
jgi:hypothetical protein